MSWETESTHTFLYVKKAGERRLWSENLDLCKETFYLSDSQVDLKKTAFVLVECVKSKSYCRI